MTPSRNIKPLKINEEWLNKWKDIFEAYKNLYCKEVNSSKIIV
jgi:hypothetical protein